MNSTRTHVQLQQQSSSSNSSSEQLQVASYRASQAFTVN